MTTPLSHDRPALEALIALAVAAGREVIEVYDAGPEAIEKADGSPVTIADQRAEAMILAGLARLAPGVPVLAEEEAAAGRIPDLGELFFCVDPLDGTRDFVEGGNGEFTVNIALVEDRVPIMGVVFAPATGALYAGEPGRAVKSVWDARASVETQEFRPIKVADGASPWRVTASRRSGGPRINGFIAHLGAIEEKRASSSIKFCLIAEGAADLYPRFGEISEWDAAAGHAVLAAAGGGVMRTDDGAPLLYGRAERRFAIDGFVAFGGENAQAETRRVLALMRKDAR